VFCFVPSPCRLEQLLSKLIAYTEQKIMFLFKIKTYFFPFSFLLRGGNKIILLMQKTVLQVHKYSLCYVWIEERFFLGKFFLIIKMSQQQSNLKQPNFFFRSRTFGFRRSCRCPDRVRICFETGKEIRKIPRDEIIRRRRQQGDDRDGVRFYHHRLSHHLRISLRMGNVGSVQLAEHRSVG